MSKNNLVPNQWQRPEVPHTLFYDSGDWASWLCSHKTNKPLFFSWRFRSAVVVRKQLTAIRCQVYIERPCEIKSHLKVLKATVAGCYELCYSVGGIM